MGRLSDLLHLGGREVLGENPTNGSSVDVNLEHDLGGCFPIFAEKLLQDAHHKLHGGVVIVEHHHLEHLRWLNLLGQSLDNQGIVITHGGA